MPSLIKEVRYVLQVGMEERFLRVQEYVWGTETWPNKCRVHVPASSSRAAKTMYAVNPDQAAEQAAKYISGPLSNAPLPGLLKIGYP